MISETLQIEINKLLTFQECQEVWATLRAQWNLLAQTQCLRFQPGDRVSWKSQQRPHDVHEGIVTRINKNTVSVQIGGSGHWKVSPNLLTQKTKGTR